MKQPQELAFAAPVSSDASLDNRGTAKLTQPTMTGGAQPVNPDNLQKPVVFTYDQATNILSIDGGTTDPDPLIITPGQTNVIKWTSEGSSFSMSMSGTPLDGDSFSVGLNSGVADNRNALALSKLQTEQVLGKGEGARGFSLLDGYGDLVQKVATFTAQSRTEADANQAMLVQATNNRNSVSAVNLDEEAANLIQFEQYYNASAQIIQVARTVFDTLINSMR